MGLISVKFSIEHTFLSVPSIQRSWSGECCRLDSLGTVACGREASVAVRGLQFLWCFIALLSLPFWGWKGLVWTVGEEIFPLFQYKVCLAAAERITSKSQGDMPGGNQHQERPSI